jgi:hypothetical protein
MTTSLPASVEADVNYLLVVELRSLVFFDG